MAERECDKRWRFFDEAYLAAFTSSQPEDWMRAALAAQQVRFEEKRAPSSIEALSYMPGLRQAEKLLRENGFEKSAQVIQFQINVLEANPEADKPVSAMVPKNIENIVHMLDELEDKGNGWNSRLYPNHANDAETKFRDMLAANWTAIRRVIPVARSDDGGQKP